MPPIMAMHSEPTVFELLPLPGPADRARGRGLPARHPSTIGQAHQLPRVWPRLARRRPRCRKSKQARGTEAQDGASWLRTGRRMNARQHSGQLCARAGHRRNGLRNLFPGPIAMQGAENGGQFA